MSRLLVTALSVPIRIYQWTISPLLGPRCRFYPSCSHYALQALSRHGVIAGMWLSIARLARCHPWNPGGVDEVPTLLRGGRWPLGYRTTEEGGDPDPGLPGTISPGTIPPKTMTGALSAPRTEQS